METGFEVWRCPDCGLGRTWPPVPAGEIARYYSATYYGKENVRFNPVFERMTRLFQSRRARVVNKRIPRGPVLDVGCGRGFLLSHLRSLGLEPCGLEFSDTAAWHARHRLGLKVETGDFLKSRYPRGRFSAVVFWHTLEHLSEPAQALQRAGELLNPEGLLAIAVPNFESLQARLFGRHWFHLDIPRHYFHFGTKSLEELLARNRFRVVKLDHFCFEQNPYGWLQSSLNILGFEHNLLYALLKHESAKTLQIREHPFQAAAILLLLGPLLAASVLMTLLEAGLRRGGTIEVYAVKE